MISDQRSDVGREIKGRPQMVTKLEVIGAIANSMMKDAIGRMHNLEQLQVLQEVEGDGCL